LYETYEVVTNFMIIVGGDVSLATNHSIMIRIQEFLTNFYRCGIGAPVRMLRKQVLVGMFALSECASSLQ